MTPKPVNSPIQDQKQTLPDFMSLAATEPGSMKQRTRILSEQVLIKNDSHQAFSSQINTSINDVNEPLPEISEPGHSSSTNSRSSLSSDLDPKDISQCPHDLEY